MKRKGFLSPEKAKTTKKMRRTQKMLNTIENNQIQTSW
jgi:hypothetical protein